MGRKRRDKVTPFDEALRDVLDRSDRAGLDTGKILGEALERFFTKIKPTNPMQPTTGVRLSLRNGELVEADKEEER